MDRDPLAEAAARGQRADLCNEFIGPILKDIREGYTSRIAEIAATEINANIRCEKITALSFALRILTNVENGLDAAIEAGHVAQRSLLRTDEIERLSDNTRRLLETVPLR